MHDIIFPDQINITNEYTLYSLYNLYSMTLIINSKTIKTSNNVRMRDKYWLINIGTRIYIDVYCIPTIFHSLFYYRR